MYEPSIDRRTLVMIADAHQLRAETLRRYFRRLFSRPATKDDRRNATPAHLASS